MKFPSKDKYEQEASYILGMIKSRRRRVLLNTKDRKLAITTFREFRKKYKSAWIVRDLPLSLCAAIVGRKRLRKARKAITDPNPFFKLLNKKKGKKK